MGLWLIQWLGIERNLMRSILIVVSVLRRKKKRSMPILMEEI
jgi:hypothetical protein